MQENCLQRTWHLTVVHGQQVEQNLRQRSTEAEQEAREAVERERIAQERLKQHVDSTALLEARVAALQVRRMQSIAERGHAAAGAGRRIVGVC